MELILYMYNIMFNFAKRMTTKVLHITNPSKDVLNIFMRLRTEKEEKTRSIKKSSSNQKFKKI